MGRKCSPAGVGCMSGIKASAGVPPLSRCELRVLQKHAELVEAYGVRAAAAADYLRLVRPALDVHTAQLHDAKARRPARPSDQSSSCGESRLLKLLCLAPSTCSCHSPHGTHFTDPISTRTS